MKSSQKTQSSNLQKQSYRSYLPIICGILVFLCLLGFYSLDKKIGLFTQPIQEIGKQQVVVAEQQPILEAQQIEQAPTPVPNSEPMPDPEPIPAPEPTQPVTYDRPYNHNGQAVIGSFIEIGKDMNKSVYVYKVRERGDNKLLFSRFSNFKPGADATKFTVLDETSTAIADGTPYKANQILYVEYLEANPELEQTVPSVAKKVKNPEVKVNTDAASCVVYEKFFQCVLKNNPNLNKDDMTNQLYGFLGSIKDLSTSEQDNKCQQLIEDIKAKSLSNSQQPCIDKLR